MRKMFVAGLLALAVTAGGQQKASAWCKFTFGIGFKCSYETTGCCWNWNVSCVPNPPPCNYGCGYGIPGCAYGYTPAVAASCASGYQYAPAYGANANAYAAPSYAAPAYAAPAYSQTQQVGYTFYGQGYAPSYWGGY